mmetsp:Transcript_26603/g.68287  ORF Transcript_26603/g.68287 Transcript_26603/m.68287 type:complete len:108 (+) Transcript_26603:347-670(+)
MQMPTTTTSRARIHIHTQAQPQHYTRKLHQSVVSGWKRDEGQMIPFSSTYMTTSVRWARYGSHTPSLRPKKAHSSTSSGFFFSSGKRKGSFGSISFTVEIQVCSCPT